MVVDPLQLLLQRSQHRVTACRFTYMGFLLWNTFPGVGLQVRWYAYLQLLSVNTDTLPSLDAVSVFTPSDKIEE